MIALGEKPAFRPGNQALFDYLDEQFVGTEPKEPVRAQAVFREGREACLSLESGDTKVQVYGDVCQRAEKQPASREGAARQLRQDGRNAFADGRALRGFGGRAFSAGAVAEPAAERGA